MKIIVCFVSVCILFASGRPPWLNENKTDSSLSEGDIAFNDAPDSSEQTSQTKVHRTQVQIQSSRTQLTKKWKNKTVPFKIGMNFNNKQRSIILAAIAEIEQNTCLKFIHPTNEVDYISFRKVPDGQLCASLLGRNSGRQNVNLTEECVERNTVLHELMHALGFAHEHTRYDRNIYIKVDTSKVVPFHKQRLELIRQPDKVDKRFPYDYKSITHYPEDAFSIYTNGKTITSNFRWEIIKADGLSDIDIWKIKFLYKCNVVDDNEDEEEEEEEEEEENSLLIVQSSTTGVATIETTTTSRQTMVQYKIKNDIFSTITPNEVSPTERALSDLNTQLFRAVENGDEKKVRQLVNAGADVNARKNCLNTTALHIAIERAHWNIASFLVSRSADTNAKDHNGEAPLHIAASSVNPSIVEILLANNASIEMKSGKNGFSPLHYAAKRGRMKVFTVFLNRGANIESTDFSGRTPLHTASNYNQKAVVSILLERGANIFAKGKWTNDPVDRLPHLTALDIAKNNEYTEIVEILERKQRQLTG